MSEKNHATSPHTKSCNLSMHKITQPLFLFRQPLHQTNHSTSSQEKHATSAQKKACKLSAKTLGESQNAALRTLHRLSNGSNCTFQKYLEKRRRQKSCVIFFVKRLGVVFSLMSLLSLQSLL